MFPSIVKILLVIDTSVISGVGTEVPNKFPKKLAIQLKGLLDLVGFGEKDFVGGVVLVLNCLFVFVVEGNNSGEGIGVILFSIAGGTISVGGVVLVNVYSSKIV